MEASEPATEKSMDSEPITRPRRRVWPLVGMLILGTGIALLVLIFAKPQLTPYRFLKDADMYFETERVYELGSGHFEYYSSSGYTQKTPFKQFASQMESELKALGFDVIMRVDGSLAMRTPSGDDLASAPASA